jgi:aryl-alcohol dehydrogenase-like predicted oxidoreductase
VYAQRVSQRGLEIAARFAPAAAQYGLTSGQAALLWAKDQPGITATIVGPRTPAQFAEMIAVADSHPDEGLRVAVDQLVPPGAAVANFHNSSGWMRDQVVESR